MAEKIMRRGDTPPSVKTEDELETLRPDELEAEISTHRAFAAWLGKEDPGQGLSGREAAQARARHLAQVNRHVEAAQTAEQVLGPHPDSKEAQKEHRAAVHAGHRPLGQPLSATDPAMRQFYIDKHKASEEARMAREQKQQERLQREREENPPDPRAVSISAAVLADEVLVDLFEMKPRASSTTSGSPDAQRT